jgi:myosin heavy chain 6/7
MRREAGNSDDKSKKAMLDAARLAEELRSEQDVAQAYERERKLQECQVKDMQMRLDDAESNALKGGKKAMHKMESRIRELESEVDAEARRMADATKNLQASERHIKEISLKQGEDAANKLKMDVLIDSLHSKIGTFKKQIEEAEEIASLNLTKYRQTQSSLADASQRADLNEKALAKSRATARSLMVITYYFRII